MDRKIIVTMAEKPVSGIAANRPFLQAICQKIRLRGGSRARRIPAAHLCDMP